jgi:hypothetical protein
VATGIPVPVKVSDDGLGVALSLTIRIPPKVPVSDGSNTTLIGHVPPAARLVPHVFVCRKSNEVVPVSVVIAMLDMVSDALPVLESVTT